MLIKLLLVVLLNLSSALGRENSLTTVHSVVVFFVFLFSGKEVRVVDVLLGSLPLQVNVEEELLPLVLRESSVQDIKSSDELVLGCQVLVVGEEVSEG